MLDLEVDPFADDLIICGGWETKSVTKSFHCGANQSMSPTFPLGWIYTRQKRANALLGMYELDKLDYRVSFHVEYVPAVESSRFRREQIHGTIYCAGVSR
jgi:hypothetical protein